MPKYILSSLSQEKLVNDAEKIITPFIKKHNLLGPFQVEAHASDLVSFSFHQPKASLDLSSLHCFSEQISTENPTRISIRIDEEGDVAIRMHKINNGWPIELWFAKSGKIFFTCTF